MRAVLNISGEADGIEAAVLAGPDLILLDPPPGGDPAGSLRQIRAAAADTPVFLRLPPLSEGGAEALEAAMPAAPAGIWLRAAVGRAQVEQLGSRLAVLEARLGLADGATRIVASVESAAGALALPSLAGSGRRLAGLTFDPASLAREIGCELPDGELLPEPVQAVAASLLLVAAAARVPAIHPGTISDATAFAAKAERAGRNGFSAILASDPGQVAALRRLGGQAPLGRWMENFVSGVATK